MSYLDPKEDVIDLELTSYGKYLLSIGKLKPSFYAFFDDDVIYDQTYAGVTTEKQSDIEPRIQEETPKFSTQTTFSGRDLEIFSTNPNIINDLVIGSEFSFESSVYEAAVEQGKVKVQDQAEHDETLQHPLGRSDTAKEFAPSWNVAFLKAPLSTSSEVLTVSSSRGDKTINIPQLNADVQYQIERNTRRYNIENNREYVFNESEDGEELFDPPFGGDESVLLLNGNSVFVKKDSLILKVEEANTFFESDNFEIELFKVDTVQGKTSEDQKEILVPLKFYKNTDLLLDDSINNQIDPQSADYYFDVLIDADIPIDDICPLIKNDTVKQVFHSKIFDCEELEMLTKDGFLEGVPDNIYADEDDTEDVCDL